MTSGLEGSATLEGLVVRPAAERRRGRFDRDSPREPFDAAIIVAPAGELVPLALQSVRKGGSVVCGGIHMTDVPSFPNALLWNERHFVARVDGLALCVRTTTYPLARAQQALDDLRAGRFQGAAVLVP